MSALFQGELELTAHARHTDPSTSHEAAASLSSDALRKSQYAVLSVLRECGPLDDQRLLTEYAWSELLPQSDSGLRTRRKELVSQGLVEDSGVKASSLSGRRMIVWQVTDKGISRYKEGR